MHICFCQILPIHLPTERKDIMIKIVIIEPDVKKQSQIKQTLQKELMSWLEPEYFYVSKVVSEVDFTSSLEEYLGCPPDKVFHLEDMSVDSFKADMKRNDVPQWIRMNTHFLGDKIEAAAPDIVITKNDYNDDDILIYNIPFLKKNGSPDRFMFLQAADGDHVGLLKRSCYLLHGSPVLTYLLTDDSMQTLPTNKDGMSNYLPYAWKGHFPDQESHVIVRMNAVLDNVESLVANENLYLQYDKLDDQVVQNLSVIFTQLEGKWIHLYRDKYPEKRVQLTAALLALIKEASSISAELNQISISLSSQSSGKLICTLDLPCHPSGADVLHSQTLETEDFQVLINYQAEQPINVDSLIKFEQVVTDWAQMEFELFLGTNTDLIYSINGVLKGNAERLGEVIQTICEDLENSSFNVNDPFKHHHIKALEYIKQKFDYIAGFTDCYVSGEESWMDMTIAEIVNKLNDYQHVFQCLDDTKTINVSINADDKTRKVWLPNNGIYCMANILEAVIRNTLKHEKHPNNEYNFKLEIEGGGVCKFFWEDSNSTTGMQTVRQSLNKRFVFDDGHIDNSLLGLKELRASMRYLYDGILAFFEQDDSIFMFVDPAYAIVEIDNGWGCQFNLRTSKPDVPPQHIREKMDTLREANLVALSAIMARNFSHNIGSHALLSLINKVECKRREIKILSDDNKERKDVLKKLEDVLNNLKTVYEYIRNKADFLSSFAFAGDGIVLHSESILDVQEEYKKYAYVFSRLAKGTSGLNVCFEEDDLRVMLPESGIFAFFNLMEILLWQSNFSGKDSCLCLQFLPQDTLMEVYMIWMKEALTPGELYQNREIQDVALYLQGIAPLYWREKCDRAVWGELSSCAFKLLKAKDLYFVIDNDKKIVNGFDCENIDVLQKKLQDGLVISHEFLIFVDICDKKKEYFLGAVPRNQLPFRIIDMKSEEIVMDQLDLLAKAWRDYAERRLFNERLLEPEKSGKEYHLFKINGKQAYSGNHGLGYDPEGRLYYYNEGASSVVQRSSPLYQSTHTHELTKAISSKKRPAIWAEMDSSKQNKWLCDKYAIFDYTTLPVVIIDERIQSYGSDEGLYEIWNKMHVYVPEEGIYGKLDAVADLDKVVEEYLKQVCNQLEKVGLKSEFCALVFHESLLYSWVNKQENQENSIMSYLQDLKKKFPQTHVYLMTGRGKSQYVKQDEENLLRFVQFTPVYTACRKEGIDKFKMYNLLMSARK